MRVYTTKSLRTLYYCVRCIKMFSTIVVKYMLVSPKCLIINSSTLGCAMEYEVSLFLSLRGYPCRHIYICMARIIKVIVQRRIYTSKREL